VTTLQKLICSLPFSLRKHRLITTCIKIFPFWVQSKIKFNDFAYIFGDLRDAEARQTFRTQGFEEELFSMVDALLPDNGTVFDVGANFGCCSFGIYSRRKDSNIQFHLFEPNPVVISCLEKAKLLQENKAGQFQLHKGCVTDQPGTSNLSFELNHTGGGYINRNEEGEIQNIVLDELVEDLKITNVDFCKMDIEGSEPFALVGAKQTLDQGIIQAIYTEISTENLCRQGHSVNSPIQLLKDSNYSLYWCRNQELNTISRPKIHIASRGHRFILAPFDKFPDDYQTDLLAIHRNASIYKEIQAHGLKNQDIYIEL